MAVITGQISSLKPLYNFKSNFARYSLDGTKKKEISHTFGKHDKQSTTGKTWFRSYLIFFLSEYFFSNCIFSILIFIYFVFAGEWRSWTGAKSKVFSFKEVTT